MQLVACINNLKPVLAGPMPCPDNRLFAALCTAIIWYLLRVSELTALNVSDVLLNVSDVLCAQGPGEMRPALRVWKSKTDQEAGELVARTCARGVQPTPRTVPRSSRMQKAAD